jgi:ribosomal protein S18 acetylase RimI-like enzyme
VELDRLAARAWPPLEEECVGEWRLRFSRGVTNRANSVLPLGPDEGPALAERLAAVETAYRRRGLPPKFQLIASAWPPELADALRVRGYVEDSPTLVMSAPIGDWHSTGTRLARAWHREWFDVWWTVDRRGGDAEAGAARGILDRIEPETRFADRGDGDRVAAVGLGVLDGDWLGVYCMATLPDARRRGHAGAILGELLGWGAAAGARNAHLSVAAGNVQAQALYRSFGFEAVQEYRYFTAAG